MSSGRLPRRGVTLLEILIAVVMLSVTTATLTAASSHSSWPTGQPIVVNAELPPNVTLAPWPGSLTFNTQGLPDQGLNAWVIGPNSRFRIVVYAASGIVRVDLP